jgi:hypothetical protein
VTIAVGTAAVGRITLTANPTTISANGGSSTVTANVVDLNGNALVGAPVSFATSQGVLSGSLVNTDATGNAQTTLTTSIEAVVTATVGVGTGTGTGGGGGGGGGGTTPGTGGGSTSGQGTATVTVRVNPLPTVSITADGTIFTAGMPVTFSISAQPGTNSTAQIRDVVVSFGDGDSQSLGGVSGTGLKVQHRYDDEGTFTVSVRVTDTLGTVVSAATVLVVEAQPPLAVAINHSQTTNVGLTTVNFTATVTPATAVVTSYVWNFGDGSPPRTTSSNQTVHQYNDDNVTKIVTVTVTTTTGRTATGSSSVTP